MIASQRLVVVEPATAVVDVHLDARVARQLEEPVGDVHDDRVELDSLEHRSGKSQSRFGDEAPPSPMKRTS